MIRRYCDVCEGEIKRNYVDERLTPADAHFGKPTQGINVGVLLAQGKPRVQFEVTVGVGPTWNKGDLCRDCLLSAIASCDQRPRSS